MKNWGIYLLLLVLWVACTPKEPTPDLSELSPGGEISTADLSENAFGHSAPDLTYEQEDLFVIGNSFFRTNWTMAPASATARDGLGPIFNDISCSSCHDKDGRAAPPIGPNEPLSGLLFRISGTNLYGNQLQDKSISNVDPEVAISVSYEELEGTYPDGTTYSLRNPIYTFSNWSLGKPANFDFSPRIGNQLPGIGLLEAISEADLLKNVDPTDSNQDGISGRDNRIEGKIGRFGWKANNPSLKDQTAAAANNDIGLTNSVFPNLELSEEQQTLFNDLPNGGEHELTDTVLNQLVFYLQTLAVPVRRDANSTEVIEGKKLFLQANCQACHVPSYVTSSHELPLLNNQKIYPYTDLLLHDMGEGLADHKTDHLATGTEWKTPPLWGIGLIPTVNGHSFLLHDGRARNVEEAILWHAGESENSVNTFKGYTAKQRSNMIAFINSL